MIAHVVLFRPKAAMTDDEKRSFAQVFRQTLLDIPSVERARVGRVGESHQAGGIDLGNTSDLFVVVLEFTDQYGLSNYLNHPNHEELARLFWVHNESTAILDVPMRDPKNEDIGQFLV